MKTVNVICGYCHKIPLGTREVDESYGPDFTYATEFGKRQILACCENCQILRNDNGHYSAIKLAR